MLGMFLRYGRPERALLFGPLSLGDDVLCTAVLREARKRAQPFTMMTARPELFQGNPDPACVIPIDNHYVQALRSLGVRVVQPYYQSLRSAFDTTPPPSNHFIAQMCAVAGIRGAIALRPYIHLSEAERAAGRIAQRQVVIHSGGRSTRFASPNKEWSPERFQEVVTGLQGEFDFVQLGASADPPLAGARDLRGRTSVRETAAIVATARLVVCQEGFLMHLARSVDVRAVAIYGGALAPAISGYSANENLYNPVPCAPCWQRFRCDYDHRCMTGISVAHVIAAVHRADSLFGHPLPTDTMVLP